MLSEVVVKPKKEKYSRKNNPAVEFMKKVIENKKALKLEENDYYQYQKYEKMKMSLNDVTPDKMEKGIYKKFSFFKDQVEVSPKTNKMILPISIKETSSQDHLPQKSQKRKDHHRRYELQLVSKSSSIPETCWGPSLRTYSPTSTSTTTTSACCNAASSAPSAAEPSASTNTT